jgi:hypothetical protein
LILSLHLKGPDECSGGDELGACCGTSVFNSNTVGGGDELGACGDTGFLNSNSSNITKDASLFQNTSLRYNLSILERKRNEVFQDYEKACDEEILANRDLQMQLSSGELLHEESEKYTQQLLIAGEAMEKKLKLEEEFFNIDKEYQKIQELYQKHLDEERFRMFLFAHQHPLQHQECFDSQNESVGITRLEEKNKLRTDEELEQCYGEQWRLFRY